MSDIVMRTVTNVQFVQNLNGFFLSIPHFEFDVNHDDDNNCIVVGINIRIRGGYLKVLYVYRWIDCCVM